MSNIDNTGAHYSEPILIRCSECGSPVQTTSKKTKTCTDTCRKKRSRRFKKEFS